MKLPLIDYRQFRLSRLNAPQFRHLKLLLFWPIFSLVFCYLENYRPTVYYAPMRCALDHWIPFCKWFVIPYAFWFLFVGGMLLYTLFYNIPAFRRDDVVHHPDVLLCSSDLPSLPQLPASCGPHCWAATC